MTIRMTAEDRRELRKRIDAARRDECARGGDQKFRSRAAYRNWQEERKALRSKR